ncbi:MAG: peptidase S1 [Verrucomicrobia bacterium]|nr:MAG: peptidase S1 [Verrucomicrobiota bacterium]
MKRVFNHYSGRLTALTVAGALTLAGVTLAFTQKPKSEEKTPPNVALDERPIPRDAASHNSFAPVVKRVAPAVVKVSTVAKAHNMSFNGGGPDIDEFFRHFFGDQMPGRVPAPRPNYNAPRQHGVGSGVIVSKDGYILTNNHVVDGAEDVKVSMQDGREFNAKVIGRDPKSDVAVIKIEAKDLPSVPMADSEKVEVGDVVLAVGNPFGIGQTVTSGIVSATGRGNAVGLDYEDFIQTDAAINPGNSGGALVDAEGRLVGINTAIYSRSGGNEGIGFAIPTNLARDVMDDLIKNGKVTRGYLGVIIQDVNPALAKEFNLKNATGALVGDVTPRGPADKAGIKSGDVITEYNGKKVTDSRHLKLEVGMTKPGETVPVKVLRDGSTRTLEVTVKTLPGDEQVAKNDSGEKQDTGTLNGVGVADLDNAARQQYDVPANLKGVIITGVEPNSPSAEAGLKPGDVILEINRKPVHSSDEAVKMTENTDNKVTLLRIWSKGGSHYVVVDESKAG